MTPRWSGRAAEWVAAHIDGCERGFGECQALGIYDKAGTICAGVVFHDWNPERGLIEMSAAATDRRWLTRGVAAVVLGYAFRVARMAVARTSERNTPVRRLWAALGASEYLIPDLWGKGEAGVILTLTEPQWQKSRLHDGQAKGTDAP